MRSFDRAATLIDSVPAPVARSLATVDQGRGVEALHRAQLPGLLQRLALRARVQSVESSALEGIIVPDDQ